jgi:hypothetical protein
VLSDVVDHLRTDRIGVPFGLVEEPLHAIRGRLPGALGQLPTVAALDLAEQPGDNRPTRRRGSGRWKHGLIRSMSR